MKRQRVELAQVASHDNLALACWKAAQGKRQRPAVARFLADADARLAALGQCILAGQAPLGRARRFVIHDPKRREITAACFEDRVLHHAMLNVAEARFERALVGSAYACRPGKGVHAAVAAVQRGLQRWPWVVQVDVAGYFGSIQHRLLMQQLGRLFKGDEFLTLWARVLAAGAVQPGVGLPIGALTSQHLANHHLGAADRLLLAHLGVGAHVRYMDDVVWCCASLEAAHHSLGPLRARMPLVFCKACPRGARRLVGQPPRQRSLGLPQQEAPRGPQPQPGLPLCPELLRLARQRRWCAPLGQPQDQRRRPVARRPHQAAACKPQGPQGAGRQQALPNAPWVVPMTARCV